MIRAMISRRRYLISVASVVTSLAGCQSVSPAVNETPAGPKLEVLGVGNLHSEPHAVHVRVRRNGELVLERYVDLDGYSEQADTDEAAFRDALPDEPGQYEVVARLNDHAERTAEITDGNVCRVDVIVQKNGELGISSRRDCERE